MARATRQTKRIHEYLIRDESIVNTIDEIQSEENTNDDTNSETTAPAKRRRTEKPPRILDGKYFEIVKLEGTKVEALCTLCKKPRRGDIDSTGNFMKHIKQSHPELIDDVEAYRKQLDEDDGNVTIQKKSQKTIQQMMMKKYTSEEVSCCDSYYLFGLIIVTLIRKK